MHIPDGFLSTPVWATLDVAAVPAIGYMVRRAQRGFDDAKIPLLGVMGAFGQAKIFVKVACFKFTLHVVILFWV